MGRKGATPDQGLRATADGLTGNAAIQVQRPFGGKSTLVAAAFMVLLVLLAFSVTHEATTVTQPSRPAVSRPAAPPKPAFTRAEEAYIQALWPIHGDVERSAARMSLGKIFYKTNDLGKADLKARADASLATYRRAEARISALQPPQSLAHANDDYLAAVRLFEQSAIETLKMFDDGNDEHLLAAHPLSQEGTNKIREVGARYWQDEYPPN